MINFSVLRGRSVKKKKRRRTQSISHTQVNIPDIYKNLTEKTVSFLFCFGVFFLACEGFTSHLFLVAFQHTAGCLALTFLTFTIDV